MSRGLSEVETEVEERVAGIELAFSKRSHSSPRIIRRLQ